MQTKVEPSTNLSRLSAVFHSRFHFLVFRVFKAMYLLFVLCQRRTYLARGPVLGVGAGAPL